MKKLDSKEALSLLFDGVIENPKELSLDKNRWVRHSIYVGIAAGRIVRAINNNYANYTYFKEYLDEFGPLDDDYATALGYIHDIGRKISHPLHTTEGYKLLCELGHEEEARATLTHSFIDNDVNNSADGITGEDRKKAIIEYLNSIQLTAYDNIVQLCDLFCLETGFTTVERRLYDIVSRKGVYENTLAHFYKTLELKRRFEPDDDYIEILSKELDKTIDDFSLYALFPEIPREELASQNEDRNKLLRLINNSKIKSL